MKTIIMFHRRLSTCSILLFQLLLLHHKEDKNVKILTMVTKKVINGIVPYTYAFYIFLKLTVVSCGWDVPIKGSIRIEKSNTHLLGKVHGNGNNRTKLSTILYQHRRYRCRESKIQWTLMI